MPYHLEKKGDPHDSVKEVGHLSTKHQENSSLSNSNVRRTLSFLPQVEWIPRCPDSKEGQIPCSGLNAGSSFIAKDEVMYESPLEILEKALGALLIWKHFSHLLTL